MYDTWNNNKTDDFYIIGYDEYDTDVYEWVWHEGTLLEPGYYSYDKTGTEHHKDPIYDVLTKRNLTAPS